MFLRAISCRRDLEASRGGRDFEMVILNGQDDKARVMRVWGGAL